MPVAEILKYIAAGPRREVLGPGALLIPLDFRDDIAEYRRNIAGVELLHCRELLLQSDQLIAKTKISCVLSGMIPLSADAAASDGSRTITANLLPNQRCCAAAKA